MVPLCKQIQEFNSIGNKIQAGLGLLFQIDRNIYINAFEHKPKQEATTNDLRAHTTNLAGQFFGGAFYGLQFWWGYLQNTAGHMSDESPWDTTGYCVKNLSKTIFAFPQIHQRVRKYPTMPTPEAVKQLQSYRKKLEKNLENTQPQKRHGQNMMHSANSQLKRALRAVTIFYSGVKVD